MVHNIDIEKEQTKLFTFGKENLMVFSITDMLTELSRREKEANIKPDPDIDVYMKVKFI
jgi:hypothetical protein